MALEVAWVMFKAFPKIIFKLHSKSSKLPIFTNHMLPDVFIKYYQIYEHLNSFEKGGNKFQTSIRGCNNNMCHVKLIFSYKVRVSKLFVPCGAHVILITLVGF